MFSREYIKKKKTIHFVTIFTVNQNKNVKRSQKVESFHVAGMSIQVSF